MITIGCDEVGLGAVAGAVAVAAVVLGDPIDGVRDSKQCSPRERAKLCREIRATAQFWVIAASKAATIDRVGIEQAHMHCMFVCARIALDRYPAATVIVDGNRPILGISQSKQKAIVKADATVPEVGAASIIAKVFRDATMMEAHLIWPEYGFCTNMGYPTQVHKEALALYGPCPIHRRSYGPVRAAVLRRKREDSSSG